MKEEAFRNLQVQNKYIQWTREDPVNAGLLKAGSYHLVLAPSDG
jgi:hypothetical protein